MNFKEKFTNKSVYVVPPLAALVNNRSWDAPILFFAALLLWCTQNLISLTTTGLNQHDLFFFKFKFLILAMAKISFNTCFNLKFFW